MARPTRHSAAATNIPAVAIILLLLIAAAASALTAAPIGPELFPDNGPSRYRWIYDYPVYYEELPADSVTDAIEFDEWGFPANPFEFRNLPKATLAPIVFDGYRYFDSIPMVRPENPSRDLLENPGRIYGWLDDMALEHSLQNNASRAFESEFAPLVRYNLDDLPVPPKHYRAAIEPMTSQLVLRENPRQVSASQASDMNLNIGRYNWLNTFSASLQFSQAYISPNWYQGGNNNLNMIANLYWNIKLNEAFHPNTLFETTVQYKLGLNSAPDDSLRNYSISEDLFQISSKYGYKAVRHWYYSLMLDFRTQLLNSYASNTRNLTSSFLSPGDLKIGAGMTYEISKKNFSFNASISPLSWNMKTCLSSRLNETNFGIEPGHVAVHSFGSSTNCKMTWKIAYNINYTSTLNAFTNYEYFTGDWEHTVSFDVNRFLTTQIYVHMRYDTQTPRQADNDWHKFQVKEIFSFGLSYRFSTK
ncbi:MAG: DUF3078 domain-containing protein [Clostridium sp.]|nr:DUF3078 domain-containing protein [Clostridium sp.]